jgi:hypothetical protein
MGLLADKCPETVDELKESITKLVIETGQGLWKTVIFEEIPGDEPWCASESAVGSGVREIIYCGHEGLKRSYKELVDYKQFIDSGDADRFRLNASGRSALPPTGEEPPEINDVNLD